MTLRFILGICDWIKRSFRSYRRIVISVAFTLFTFMMPFCLQAMTVSPVLVDVSIDPGVIIEKTIFIKNESKAISYYSLMAENFTASGETGAQAYSGDGSSDLASWISWSTSTIVVLPGEVVSVPVRISVPNDAGAGGHYATLFVSRVNANDKNNVGLYEQIGVLFLVRVSGEIVDAASIESFRLKSNRSLINHLPAAFELRIRNNGGSHIRPEGSVVLKNAIGRIVSVLPINRTGGAVLPRSVRKFDANWGRVDNSCDAGFWSSVRNELNHFAFGFYTADVHATYGDQHQSLNRASISFWVIPWHLMIVCFGGLLLLLIAYRVFKHCLICRLVAEAESRRGVKKSSSSKKKK